jgi:Lrp/AsnC family leucine-responsive transcriptional regulator
VQKKGHFLVLDNPLDIQIVQLLVDDGRKSYTDLGRDTGLSVSAAHQRVRQLERRDVITGYSATINFTLIGMPLSAFITLTDHRADSDAAIAALTDITEIVACYTIAGSASYLIHARLADLAALEGLLHHLRTRVGLFPRTEVVLSTCFERPPRLHMVAPADVG